MVLLLTLFYTQGTETQRGEEFAQAHTDARWLSPDLDSRGLAPEAESLTTARNCFEFSGRCILAFSEAQAFVSGSREWWLQEGDCFRCPWLARSFLSFLRARWPHIFLLPFPASWSGWEPPWLRLREADAESWPQLQVSQNHRQETRCSTSQKFIYVSVHSLIPVFSDQSEVEASRKPEAERRKGEEETCPLILRFSLLVPSCH